VKRGLSGDYFVKKTGDEIVRAFVPKPLPPVPPLVVDPALRDAMDEALISLGRLSRWMM